MKMMEEEGDITTTSKLALLKYMSEVQSRISKDISEDFVLAKLGEQNKEGIIEMTSNAYYAKKLMESIKRRATRWHWRNKKWVKEPLEQHETKQIEKAMQQTFDAYMVRIYMTAILNRNVSQNYLVRILAGEPETEEEKHNIEAQEDKTFKERMKKLLKPEK